MQSKLLIILGFLFSGFLGWYLSGGKTEISVSDASQTAHQFDEKTLLQKIADLELQLAAAEKKINATPDNLQSISCGSDTAKQSTKPQPIDRSSLTQQPAPAEQVGSVTKLDSADPKAIATLALPQLFEDEPFDLEAEARETKLRDAMLLDEDFQNKQIRDVKCKATVCRVSFVKIKTQMEPKDYQALASSVGLYLVKNSLGVTQNMSLGENSKTGLVEVYFSDDIRK